MIPKLPITELMISVRIDKYGFGDETAPANLDLGRTRNMLLAFLQDAALKDILESPENEQGMAALTFSLRKLFVQMYEDWTIPCTAAGTNNGREYLGTPSMALSSVTLPFDMTTIMSKNTACTTRQHG